MPKRSPDSTVIHRPRYRAGAWLGLLVPGALVAFGACSAGTGTTTSSGSGGATSSGGGTSVTTTVTTGNGGAGGATGTGGSIPVGCLSNADCTADPARTLCDVNNGDCVGCLVANDTCPQGQYCNPATDLCAVGCNDANDCNLGSGLYCNQSNHTCVGCLIDNDCPSGSICVSSTCVAGCSPNHACQIGFSCCGSSCFDLSTDVDHCGDCDKPCDDLANASTLCSNSICTLGPCLGVFADCDGDAATGCEQNTLQDGPCLCTPGSTQSCYQGGVGTEGIGPCAAGTQTCSEEGTSWGSCTGQVLPASEVCANSIDDDCDGQTDNGSDQDGDGWTSCQGDCCDAPSLGCTSPALVNPGAYEVVANGLDDDCNAATSDVVAAAACSTVQKFTTVTASDVASAIDICQITTANPILPSQKTWGLITATHSFADGSVPSASQLANIQNFQTAILQDYGSAVVPKVGATMAGISTGRMRDQNDTGFATPDGGSSFGVLGQPPAAYLAAQNPANVLPASAGCSGNCAAGSGANDSVNVKLTIRVPTNAQSFSYQFKFYSAEFPEYQCTQFNDFYLALLSSNAPGIPADQNISFDGLGNVFSVNNGFFDVCAPAGCNTCPDGVTELTCTGMQGAVIPCLGGIGTAGIGGGSKWLTTDAPIIPGETMTLQLMVFDVGDNAWDSLSLLDNFHWNLQPAAVSTHQ